MKIAGVDCGGSKVAIAILDGETLNVHRFAATAKDRHAVLRDVTSFATTWLNHCDLVYIEEPLIGRGVRASLMVTQTAGAVMSHLKARSYFVPVASWKKAVIGSGNAPKGLVESTLRELHPRYSTLCGGDQDLVDATCLALYGRAQQDVVERITAHD